MRPFRERSSEYGFYKRYRCEMKYFFFFHFILSVNSVAPLALQFVGGIIAVWCDCVPLQTLPGLLNDWQMLC